MSEPKSRIRTPHLICFVVAVVVMAMFWIPYHEERQVKWLNREIHPVGGLEFLEAYREAYNSKDFEAILKMVYLEGERDSEKRWATEFCTGLGLYNLNDLKLISYSPYEFPYSSEKQWHVSLNPKYSLVVKLGPIGPNDLSLEYKYPVGEKDGQLYFCIIYYNES